jgi:hypothetical protein
MGAKARICVFCGLEIAPGERAREHRRFLQGSNARFHQDRYQALIGILANTPESSGDAGGG